MCSHLVELKLALASSVCRGTRKPVLGVCNQLRQIGLVFTHNLVIEDFITYLKRKFHNEKYISIINNKFDKFIGKWSTLYQFFQGTNNNENN